MVLIRKLLIALSVVCCLSIARPVSAKDVAHKLGVGASISSSGVGLLDLRYALKTIEIIVGFDFDLTKLSGKPLAIDVGIDLAIFIKVFQSQYVNAGPEIGATLGIRDSGSNLTLHPQVRVAFKVLWFPNGNNYLAFFVSADLSANIVLQGGAVFPNSANNPGAKGFGIGLTPNLRAGFTYYF